MTFTDKPTPQPCPPLIRRYRPRCLLRAGLQHGPVHLEQVAAAREVGALVFMECQSHQTSLKEPQVVEALQAVDIFAPNAQEAAESLHAERKTNATGFFRSQSAWTQGV